MPHYRVSVNYLVEVVDEDALLAAGLSAWQASAGGWAVRVDEDGGVVEITDAEADALRPGPEASIASVLGAEDPPSVPGVWFASSGIDVEVVGEGPPPGG